MTGAPSNNSDRDLENDAELKNVPGLRVRSHLTDTLLTRRMLAVDAARRPAVLLAARAVSQPEWQDAALSVARRAALRPRQHTGVVDAGLCHGTAGLAHLYNRLFQSTGERDFGVEARYWIERTFAYRGLGGVAGYRRVDLDGTQSDDAGLLTGAAGIALALFAAASTTEPIWDRALLLSTRM